MKWLSSAEISKMTQINEKTIQRYSENDFYKPYLDRTKDLGGVHISVESVPAIQFIYQCTTERKIKNPKKIAMLLQENFPPVIEITGEDKQQTDNRHQLVTRPDLNKLKDEIRAEVVEDLKKELKHHFTQQTEFLHKELERKHQQIGSLIENLMTQKQEQLPEPPKKAWWKFW